MATTIFAVAGRLQTAENDLSEQKLRQEKQAQNKTEINAVNVVYVAGDMNVGGDVIAHADFHQVFLKPKDYPLLKALESKESVTWHVPRQDNVFVGRKDLLESLHTKLNPTKVKDAELKEIKEQDETQRTVLAINACAGLGGVGKTQLALEYIHHTEHKYSLKAWFSAEKVEQLEQQYVEFAKDLGYEEEKPDIKEAIKHIKRCLAKYPGWLLVYDNVEKYEDIAAFLPDEGGSVLITTRNQRWPAKVEHLPIDVMDEKDAIALVKKLTAKEGAQDAEIKALVAILGYLPLALAQASAYIREKGKTVAEYLALYKQYEAKLLTDKTLPEGTDHAPVAITWNTSLEAVEDKLKEASMPSVAHALMTVCAYFAPENIPKTVLLIWLKGNYSNIDAPELVLDELLAQLQRYSLISVSVDKQQVSLHRLVQAVLRHQVQVKKAFDVGVVSLTEDWYKHVLEAVNQEFNRSTTVLEDQHRERALFLHLQALDSYYDEVIKRPDRGFELARANVLFNIGFVFNRIGNPKSAKALYERALKIEEQHYGSEHPEVARTLGNLGTAYSDLGDVNKAKALLERALKVKEQHYGPEHPEVATTLVCLGAAYRDLGDANQAKALYERALKIQEQHYGPEHPQVALTLGNLGTAYYSLGDAKQAKVLLERELKIKEQHYGPEHPEVALTVGNLGTAYRDLGDANWAKGLYERALKIEERHYGPEHPKVAFTVSNLGAAYSALEDGSTAKTLVEPALKIQEQTYGKEHPTVALTLVNLGTAHRVLGDAGQAKTFYERALTIQERHYGAEHFEVAATLHNLVLAHRALSEHSLAYPLAERCYQIYLKVRGAEHKDTQDAKRLLAQCKDSLDDGAPGLLAKTELIFSKPIAENKHTRPPSTSNPGAQKKAHEKKKPCVLM